MLSEIWPWIESNATGIVAIATSVGALAGILAVFKQPKASARILELEERFDRSLRNRAAEKNKNSLKMAVIVGIAVVLAILLLLAIKKTDSNKVS